MELVRTAQQTSTFYTNSTSLDSGKLNFNDPDLKSVLCRISCSRVGNDAVTNHRDTRRMKNTDVLLSFISVGYRNGKYNASTC